MFSHFDIQRVSLGGPVFDVDKLKWLNSLWLRELSAEDFCQRFARWGLTPERTLPLVPHVQPRVEIFTDVAPLAGHFLSGMPVLTADQFEHKAYADDKMLQTLQFGLWQLEAIRIWEKPEIEQRLFGLASELELKVRDFLYPFFIAIAGTSSTISVLDSMALLGPDMSRARVRAALELLGGVGKKRLKKMEKEYRLIADNIESKLAAGPETE
jgi:glutamyl-tRNA synthetase